MTTRYADRSGPDGEPGSGPGKPLPMPLFQPIRSRQTVQEAVYRALRDALMTGQFEPGQSLTIDSLAASFGTSHMPVREALRRLVAENALEQAANGSSRVPAVARDRLADLCEARSALEGLATERAAARLTAEDLRILGAAFHAHAAVTREDGVEVLLRRNRQFHFLVYSASGSEVLPQLIEALWLRFGPYLRMLSRALEPLIGTADFANGSQHHRALMEALDARNAGAARRAVVADIEETYRLLAPLIGEAGFGPATS